MSKDKISDYSATANSNTDIGGINIDEGCAPSGINDAIRTLMKQLKDWQSGSQDVYIHPAGSASVPSITATGDTNTGLFFPAADTVGIATGGTERARVDSSGNLALGTTSSLSASSGRIDLTINGTSSAMTSFGTGGTRRGYLLHDASDLTITSETAGSLRFLNNGAERARIDSSGNLGLGVTPSAWSGYKALQVSTAAGVSSNGGNGSSFSHNYYYDGTNDKYITTGNAASRVFHFNGAIRFDLAPSGTAGNNVSFTQAMTLDASGNLGIGTTSPNANARLQVVGNFGVYVGSDAILRLRNDGNAAYIESTYTGSAGYKPIVFSTSDTERARIDSSGNLLVGTTSAFAANGHNFQNANSAAFVMALRNANATSGKYWTQGPDNNNNYILYNQSGTGVYLVNGNTTWSSNSDERLKTALVPFENAVQKICSLRAGTGRYLTDEETVSRSFLIAQDVQAVLPEAVNVQSDEQGTLGLSYTDLIPLLTAAIQEQQAIITQLQADVAALKG